MKRHRLVVMLSVVLLVPMLVAVRGATVSGQEDENPTAIAIQTQIADLQATLTAIASEGTPVGENATFEYEDFTYTVTRTERDRPLAEGASEEARGVYVFVYVDVVNDGQNPESIPLSDFFLTDGEGRNFSVDYYATGWTQFSELDAPIEFQPGIDYEAVLVFDVPEDASDFALTGEETDIVVELDI